MLVNALSQPSKCIRKSAPGGNVGFKRNEALNLLRWAMATWPCWSGIENSRRFFLYRSRLLVFTQCRKKEWLLTKARVTLQLDPMPLARLSRRALLLGYRDDLLLSLLVAELDTNNSFLSGRTKEDFDWLAEDSQADSAPSSPRKLQLENRFFFAGANPSFE